MQNHPLSLIGFYDRFLSKWHMTFCLIYLFLKLLNIAFTFYYLYKNKRT